MWEMEVCLHLFLTSAIGESELLDSRQIRFITGKYPCCNWVGGSVDPTAFFDN
jgi:hypothetical protein